MVGQWLERGPYVLKANTLPTRSQRLQGLALEKKKWIGQTTRKQTSIIRMKLKIKSISAQIWTQEFCLANYYTGINKIIWEIE